MEALSEPIKCDAWQITKIKDKFGNKKINLRLYKRGRNGNGLNFLASQNIYSTLTEWEMLKILIRGTRRRKK